MQTVPIGMFCLNCNQLNEELSKRSDQLYRGPEQRIEQEVSCLNVYVYNVIQGQNENFYTDYCINIFHHGHDAISSQLSYLLYFLYKAYLKIAREMLL